MAKKGFKLIRNVKPNITGPKLRGEGSAEVQPKAQVCPVFFKPSLIASLGPTWNSTLLEFLQVILASWATKWLDFPKEPPTHTPTGTIENQTKSIRGFKQTVSHSHRIF